MISSTRAFSERRLSDRDTLSPPAERKKLVMDCTGDKLCLKYFVWTARRELAIVSMCFCRARSW